MNTIKAASLLLVLFMLQGCASNHSTMPMSSTPDNTYSRSITTNSYMYRSPPPAAMGSGVMHGGHY